MAPGMIAHLIALIQYQVVVPEISATTIKQETTRNKKQTSNKQQNQIQPVLPQQFFTRNMTGCCHGSAQ